MLLGAARVVAIDGAALMRMLLLIIFALSARYADIFFICLTICRIHVIQHESQRSVDMLHIRASAPPAD